MSEIEINRHTDTQKDRQTNRQRERVGYIQRNRPRDTDRQGRETDRGIERETGKGFLVLILTHAEAVHHERHITDVS